MCHVSKFILGFLFTYAAALSCLVDAKADEELWQPTIPEALIGPYISDPTILQELDFRDGKSCELPETGPLNFQCLVYHDNRAGMTDPDFKPNPFMLKVFDEVKSTVITDLRSIAWEKGVTEQFGKDARRLAEGFLDFDGARIELVGVVNRMDRQQFDGDKVPEHGERLACGEISVIYRFGYKVNIAGKVKTTETYRSSVTYNSRLPVTLNVVFPAIPWSKELTCAQVANRWLDYTIAWKNRESTANLLAKAKIAVSSLRPQDVDRIELNMQGSRVPAESDTTQFGTLATYIIRVFRWVPDKGKWTQSYLQNQIDRARLFKSSDGDDNTCDDQKRTNVSPEELRRELVAFLTSMNRPTEGTGRNAIGDIDKGLIQIPRKFLACRAISISPGGASRSGNQPFWNASVGTNKTLSGEQQLISDEQIANALRLYNEKFPDSLGYIRTADEFRTRLNEATCSGCHQSRAIAGFHFPGADRAGVAAVNAVFLPASPHFFGDQPRRMKILSLIAKGQKTDNAVLATSYATRPLNEYAQLRPASEVISDANNQLLAGWGGTCLVQPWTGVREWDCAKPLKCEEVFKSQNQPGMGICKNPTPKIGEAMQKGNTVTSSFGFDRYIRDPIVKDGDTRISVEGIGPEIENNSYFASHQEFYKGEEGVDRRPSETEEDYAVRIRDQETGGFPAGSLRLSECIGLEDEATCALIAGSGFNPCLSELINGERTADSCFDIYTVYAGVRACAPANPCRDDYICVSPMGYTLENANTRFKARQERRENASKKASKESKDNKTRLKINFFGNKPLDKDWLNLNNGNGDRRGVCIPPYFVFQFKADGHKIPDEPQNGK